MHLMLEGLAGDTIKNNAETMIRISNLLLIGTQSTFNDVTLLAYPGGSADKLVAEYTAEVSNKSKFKFASSGRGV